MDSNPAQRFVIAALSMALAWGGFELRDLYQSWQPMPDLALIDERGQATSLDRVRGTSQTVVVYLPPSMMNCPGIKTAGKVGREIAAAAGARTRVIGVAENATAGGVAGVKAALELPFPVYAVQARFEEMRPLMNALSEKHNAMTRRTIAGASVVLDAAGVVVHQATDGASETTTAYLKQH